MIYILIQDFGHDGSNNVWAGTNIVQLMDQIHVPKNMSFVEDSYYDLAVEVFNLDGSRANFGYLAPSDVKSLEALKEFLKR